MSIGGRQAPPTVARSPRRKRLSTHSARRQWPSRYPAPPPPQDRPRAAAAHAAWSTTCRQQASAATATHGNTHTGCVSAVRSRSPCRAPVPAPRPGLTGAPRPDSGIWWMRTACTTPSVGSGRTFHDLYCALPARPRCPAHHPCHYCRDEPPQERAPARIDQHRARRRSPAQAPPERRRAMHGDGPSLAMGDRQLQSRLPEIRARLGVTPQGEAYLHVPRTGTPSTPRSVLVRGCPFDGQKYPWAGPVQQEMLSASSTSCTRSPPGTPLVTHRTGTRPGPRCCMAAPGPLPNRSVSGPGKQALSCLPRGRCPVVRSKAT